MKIRSLMDYFTHRDHDQEQREAIIDLLNLLCLIDRKIKLTEQDYIDSFVKDLEWTSGVAIETFFSVSISKCRKALDEDKAEELIKELAAVLTDEDFRILALDATSAITLADHELNSKEKQALDLLKTQFLTE